MCFFALYFHIFLSKMKENTRPLFAFFLCCKDLILKMKIQVVTELLVLEMFKQYVTCTQIVHSSKADRNVYFSSRRTHKKDHSMSRPEDSVHVGVWFGSRHHTPCPRPMYWMSLSTSYPVQCIKCICTWQANHRMKILWYLWPRLSSDAFIWRCTWAQCISGFIMIFELASYDPIWVSAFVNKGVNRSMYEAGSFNQPFSSFEAQAPSNISNYCQAKWKIHEAFQNWHLIATPLSHIIWI